MEVKACQQKQKREGACKEREHNERDFAVTPTAAALFKLHLIQVGNTIVVAESWVQFAMATVPEGRDACC